MIRDLKRQRSGRSLHRKWIVAARGAAAFVTLTLLAPAFAAALGSVMVVEPLESAPRAKLTVTFEGKPLAGATIEIYRARPQQKDDRPWVSLRTGNSGEVITRKLPPGDYSVIAAARQNLVASLILHVTKPLNGKDAPTNAYSSFSMALAPSQYPTFIQTLSSVEALPITNHLAEFRGVVIDQSGAAIAAVRVDVVRKGSDGKRRVARLMTDNLGRFSQTLKDGVYIALFAAPGFSTKPVLFEKSRRGASTRLSVVLQVAPSTS